MRTTVKSQIAYLERTIKEKEAHKLDTTLEKKLLKDWKAWLKKNGDTMEVKDDSAT